MNRKCRIQSKLTAIVASVGLLIGGFAPTKAVAGFEEDFLDNYDYYLSLYQNYGYSYYKYYLGLALPSYYYYSALYYGGYYSVHVDYYGSKYRGAAVSIYDYYTGLGDSYFDSYY